MPSMGVAPCYGRPDKTQADPALLIEGDKDTLGLGVLAVIAEGVDGALQACGHP